ncbi:MAG: AAA family ATPase, partial [Planctomycetaceae bacterium]|nr:AAA family ATPase [Planctomycetaceae bacterium]
MTDVIFNGSASRTGSQFAEATLIFDNTSRFIPMDQDEVSIGRRIWQSGDSEYLINRNTARLKDVRELFVGTGAGAATYCIIEQGRVDQILQSNAANRRLIFEEAAGISRFKQKRTEALKRLERVEQNLVRLSDLVDEVETQVGTVRTQAQRASRYRSVSTELEQLWVGLAADDYRRESTQRDLLQRQMQESAATLVDLRQRQAEAETQVIAADSALAEVDDQLRDVERRRSDLRSRIASLDSTARHQAAREEELRSDLQRLIRQQTLLQSRVSEAEAEESHLCSVLTLERAAFERRRSSMLANDEQIALLQQGLTDSRDRIEAARHELMQQVRLNSEAASTLSNLRALQQSSHQRRGTLEEQIALVCGEIESLQAGMPALEESLASIQMTLQQVESDADTLIRSREQMVTERSQSQQSLAELREHRSAQVARRAVLEDLEDRQEGFGIGVREILRRADEADSEPWNLICGSVADLLDVDMENAALLEVALSGRAQLLVVTQMKPLIEYLNSGRCRITDRVGFISIENTDVAGGDLSELRGSLRRNDDDMWAEGSDADADISRQADAWWGRKKTTRSSGDSIEKMLAADGGLDQLQVTWVDPRSDSPVVRSVFSQGDKAPPILFGQPGVVGRADGLARPPQSMSMLASHLLADTWVVHTLADALRLHSLTAGQCRFVTLQGELVESDGTLFAGTVRNESALLSRKSELRRLRNELHRLEHEIAQRELTLRALSQNISSTDEQLTQTRTRVNDHVSQSRTAEQVVVEQRRQLKETQRREDQLRVQEQKLAEEITELDTQIEAAQQEHQAGEALLFQQQEQISELTNEQNTRQHELEVIDRDRTAASLELTRSEERLLGLQEAVERVRDDLEQRRLQQQEADRRLTAAVERQRDLLIARLNTAAEVAELSVDDEQLAADIYNRAATRNRLRVNRNAASSAETQIREICRAHESRHHETELQVRTIDHQLTTTAERIREEFQIEVQSAVESGRSALALWLNRDSSGSVDDADAESESDQTQRLPAFTAVTEYPLFDETHQKIISDPHQYAEIRGEIDRRVERLRRQLRKIGNVGTESLDNLIELETRFQRLHTQLTDLEAARDALSDIVRRINIESRRMFLESFETIRGFFRELFRKLFGGGEADLILEDPDDVLECSIDVVARPPGKELRSISLLSGGEKTLTAVALLLSIFKSRTSPFCILDEVDAALDDGNIGRFVNVLREFQQNTQFIMITHRKPTMAVTDVLYGVTMEESGISRRLSLRFDDVDEHGNFVAAAKKDKAA